MMNKTNCTVNNPFSKKKTVACIKKIFHHAVPMIFLYVVLLSENQNINLGGACEHLKSIIMLHWWVGGVD